MPEDAAPHVLQFEQLPDLEPADRQHLDGRGVDRPPLRPLSSHDAAALTIVNRAIFAYNSYDRWSIDVGLPLEFNVPIAGIEPSDRVHADRRR